MLNYLCRFLVYNPSFRIIRFFLVTIGNIGSKRFATFALCLVYNADFPTGITGVGQRPLIPYLLYFKFIAEYEK